MCQVNGASVTRVGFGPESLNKEDGGKFSIELVETAESSQWDGAVQFIQLGMPVFRLSQVRARGRGVVQSTQRSSDISVPCHPASST